MNDRIKKLAEQCWINDGGPDSYFSKEKFAQLIIVECIDIFSQNLPEPGDGKLPEVINRICNVAEHFGVKQ